MIHPYQLIRDTIISYLRGEITEENYFEISKKNKFEKYFDENRNENIITILVGIGTDYLQMTSCIALFEYYLSKGCSPDLVYKGKKRTPLFECSYNLEIVQILVNYGANVNHKDGGGSTFVQYGTKLEVLQFAVDKGLNLKNENNMGNNILFSLFNNYYNYNEESHHEQVKILEYLLNSNSFNINQYNSNNLTVLQYAITYGDISHEALKILIEYDANPYLLTKREVSFQSWSDNLTTLQIGISVDDIIKKRIEKLRSNLKEGLINDVYYYKKGMTYYKKSLKIIYNSKHTTLIKRIFSKLV